MIEFIDDMLHDAMGIALLIVGILIALGVALIASDLCFSDIRVHAALVIQKSYQPSQSSVGTGVMSNGKVGTVVTNSEEKWSVIVSYSDGSIHVAEAAPNRWVILSKDDKVDVNERVGGILHIMWRCEIP